MSVYSFAAKTLRGEEVSMSTYRGQVLLIVNTASQCGHTPQYQGLQALYDQYQERGLVVLGFPCNQFGAQEPGTAKDIESFCSRNYGVTFPLFSKVDVNGEGALALYNYLKEQTAPEGEPVDIQWNFTKFLVDRTGEVVARYEPKVQPAEMTSDIEHLLRQGEA